MGFLQRINNRVTQVASRVMQGLNAIGVEIGETINRAALAMNWTRISDASQEFVEERDASRVKWKDRADRAQRDAVIGANTKPKVVAPNKEKRAYAEQCIQIIENRAGEKHLNEVLENQTPEQRMDFVQGLSNDFKEKTGLQLDDVKYYAAPGLEFGYYDREDNSVHINSVFLTSRNPYFVKEQIFTLFHEMTHAIQWNAVKNMANGNNNTYGFPPEQVAEWAINFLPGRYIRPNVDPEEYRNQPIERDAYWLEWQLKNQFD